MGRSLRQQRPPWRPCGSQGAPEGLSGAVDAPWVGLAASSALPGARVAPRARLEAFLAPWGPPTGTASTNGGTKSFPYVATLAFMILAACFPNWLQFVC